MKRYGVALIVAFALVVRLAVMLGTPHFRPVTDSADYDHIAMTLVDHGAFPPSHLTAVGGPTAFRPPLYPLVLAGAYALSGTGDASARWEAGRVEEALLGALSVWLIYLIARRIWGETVGLVAGGIAAIYPPLILIGSSLMSESLFVPLVLAAVLCGLRARGDPRLRWAALCGALIGLAALTRTNGIVLLLPVGVLLWGRSFRRPLVMVAATVIVLVPWTVRNYDVFHRFVPISTESGYAFAGIYNPSVQSSRVYPGLWQPAIQDVHRVLLHHPRDDEAQFSSDLDSQALRYVRAHPGSILRTSYWNALRLLNLTGTGLERVAAVGDGYPQTLAVVSVYSFWALGLLALLGAVLCVRAGPRAPWSFWACPLLIFLTTLPVIGTTRYRSPCDPFVVMLAAIALTHVGRRLASRRALLGRRSPLASAAG